MHRRDDYGLNRRCEYFVDVNDYIYLILSMQIKIVDVNNLSENLSLSNLDEHTINKEYIKDTEQLRISKIIENLMTNKLIFLKST